MSRCVRCGKENHSGNDVCNWCQDQIYEMEQEAQAQQAADRAYQDALEQKRQEEAP